jgi:hypothetical protein
MKNSIRNSQAADQTTAAALSSRNRRRKPSRVTTPTTEFGKTFQSLTGKKDINAKVNEEELFAGTVYQLVKNRFGDSVAQDFRSAYRLNLVDKPATERVASAERAAKDTLKFFVSSTLMTKEEARDIRTTAFEIAQMDDNKDALWDSIGDTKSVVTADRGARIIQQRLEEGGNAPVASQAKKASKNARRNEADDRVRSYGGTHEQLGQKVRNLIKRIG